MKKAQRLNEVKPSLTLAISAKAAQMKAEGIDVVSFGAGEPDFNTPQPVIDAAKAALDEGKTKYTPVAGLPALRAAIAQWYMREFGVETKAEEVIVSVGGKQVIYNAMMSLLDAGDKVLIGAPYWLSYPAMAHLCGAEVVYIQTRMSDHFLMTPEQLELAICEHHPVLVILNSPSNPTGQAYGEDDLAKLADVLRRHPEVTVIWDNIYAHLTYDGFKHVELVKVAPDLRTRIITCGGFSKSFAMTGWRLGFGIADPERIKAMSTIQSHSTSNATSFAQYGALAALHLERGVIEGMRKTFEKRRNLVMAELKNIPDVSYVPPVGSFYVLLDCSKFCHVKKEGGAIDGDVELAQYILEKGHVATVPGTAFGASGFLRISFALDEASICKGLRRIGEVLNALRQER